MGPHKQIDSLFLFSIFYELRLFLLFGIFEKETHLSCNGAFIKYLLLVQAPEAYQGLGT